MTNNIRHKDNNILLYVTIIFLWQISHGACHARTFTHNEEADVPAELSDSSCSDISDYIFHHVQWQEIMYETTGLIEVSFIVKKNGKVSCARIKKSLTPEIDKEVLRVINEMPSWSPAKKTTEKYV